MRADIDITFDFRRDTPDGKDPDTYSETLRRYHRLLWSKPLPRGEFFELDDATPGRYLSHRSALGDFALSSDAVIPTFRWNAAVRAMVPKAELTAFIAIGYTIGGMMLFPGNRIDGKWTINQARGCTKRIGDRFDLTLECVRRHYIGRGNPLTDVLARYRNFFDLFDDFRGYVTFFMLEDLVSEDFSEVKIAEPFNDFKGSPIPRDLREYSAYMAASVDFINARNRRIQASG